jgi:hypothetical protein
MFTLNSKREGTMRYPNSPIEEPSIVNRRPTMFHCVLKYLESVANKLPGEVHQRAELLEWQLWGGHFGAITVRSWPPAVPRRAPPWAIQSMISRQRACAGREGEPDALCAAWRRTMRYPGLYTRPRD